MPQLSEFTIEKLADLAREIEEDGVTIDHLIPEGEIERFKNLTAHL